MLVTPSGLEPPEVPTMKGTFRWSFKEDIPVVLFGSFSRRSSHREDEDEAEPRQNRSRSPEDCQGDRTANTRSLILKPLLLKHLGLPRQQRCQGAPLPGSVYPKPRRDVQIFFRTSSTSVLNRLSWPLYPGRNVGVPPFPLSDNRQSRAPDLRRFSEQIQYFKWSGFPLFFQSCAFI